MDMERHDFELDDLVERIKENDHRLIALQVPEGLKMQALEMMDEIESRNFLTDRDKNHLIVSYNHP